MRVALGRRVGAGALEVEVVEVDVVVAVSSRAEDDNAALEAHCAAFA